MHLIRRALLGERPARRATGRWLRAATVATAMLALSPETAFARSIESIGVIVGDLGNAFFEQIGRSVEDAAARRLGPSTRVMVRSSGFDLNRQIGQIDAMIAQKVDLLILNAVDTQQIGPAVRRAREAGVVVVAIDVGADGAQATVTSDNRDAGRLACDYLVKQIDGKGEILILSGPPTTSIVDRVAGCQSVLSRHAGIKVLEASEDCGGTIEGGLSYMTTALTTYPNIDGVFAVNDLVGIGANIAGRLAGRTGFAIVTVDGSPRGIEALKDRSLNIVASVAQHPDQMAEKAVALGIELIAAGNSTEGLTQTFPVSLITKQDVDEYHGWSEGR